jgi:hypothetical protein
MYLSTSKLAVAAVGNLSFAVALCMYNLVIKVCAARRQRSKIHNLRCSILVVGSPACSSSESLQRYSSSSGGYRSCGCCAWQGELSCSSKLQWQAPLALHMVCLAMHVCADPWNLPGFSGRRLQDVGLLPMQSSSVHHVAPHQHVKYHKVLTRKISRFVLFVLFACRCFWAACVRLS